MAGKYDALVNRFLQAEPVHRTAARMILIAVQEDAVEPLSDAFYAGVTEEQGAAVIMLLADIGGYEALNILRDIVKHHVKNLRLRVIAAEGLLKNENAISEKEQKALQRFLSKATKKLAERENQAE